MKNRILKFRIWNSIDKKWLTNNDWEMYSDFDCIYPKALLGYYIQQFTGLLDKNNKEIYEGDILKLKIHDDIVPENNRNTIGLIEFDDFHAAWKVKCIGKDSYFFGLKDNCWVESCESKIIGNIFDNKKYKFDI